MKVLSSQAWTAHKPEVGECSFVYEIGLRFEIYFYVQRICKFVQNYPELPYCLLCTVKTLLFVYCRLAPILEKVGRQSQEKQ